jgi:hypothetical protein
MIVQDKNATNFMNPEHEAYFVAGLVSPWTAF